MFGRATIRFGIGPHSSLLSFKFKSWRNAICDCSKIYYITLIVSTPHFVNLNNNTFRLKTFLFFVHLRWQPKRTEKVISNYQVYSVTILTLLLWHVDILNISNVQNVHLEHQHRLTDDATHRWHGSQQTGPVRTTQRSHVRAARQCPHNK